MTHSLQNKAFLSVTILLAAFGLFGVIPVSIDTLTNTKACPMVLVVPACYVVTAGYFLMLLSCILSRNVLFYTGWLPVFLLAASGSVSELLGHAVCPRNSANIPLCYFSLILALMIAISFIGWKKFRANDLSRINSIDDRS